MNAVLKLMLKGSAISAVALMMSAVGCSDSDKGTETGAGGESGGGKGGTPSASGSSSGGDSTDKGGEGGAGATTSAGADAGGVDAGGADAGGADAGGADAGGADAGAAGAGAGGAAGVAVAKFCNGTKAGGNALNYILRIGEGADEVTLSATSDECSTAVGVECKAIPVGAEVPITLIDATTPAVELYSGTVEINDGEEVFFYTDLDQDNNDVVEAFTFEDATPSCKEATFEEVYE